jgi:hypothetical protein
MAGHGKIPSGEWGMGRNGVGSNGCIEPAWIILEDGGGRGRDLGHVQRRGSSLWGIWGKLGGV